jgi:hypothetical protein
MYGSAKDSGFYYSNNKIVRLKRPAELADYLAPPGSRFVILPQRDFDRVSRLPLPPGGWEPLVTDHPTHVLAVFRHARSNPAR